MAKSQLRSTTIQGIITTAAAALLQSSAPYLPASVAQQAQGASWFGLVVGLFAAYKGRLNPNIEPIGKLPTSGLPPDPPDMPHLALATFPVAPASVPTASASSEPSIEQIKALPSAEYANGQLDLDIAQFKGNYRFVALETTKLKTKPVDGLFVPIPKGTVLWVEKFQWFVENNQHLRVKLSTEVNEGLFCVYEPHWRIENSQGLAEGVSRTNPEQPWF
ncbi:hypothetical protein [Nodosilinea nodulosa]|uniref:hypothetical protein n=1 Tax=Nodosilinea nodulosa TaxID=416001 RepID=UPI0012D8224A|nr:hypothetical protein [Nodosilinea nodulosa]